MPVEYLATNIFDADGIRTWWTISFAGVSAGASSGTRPYLYPADVKAIELFRDSEGNYVSAARLTTIDPSLPNVVNIVGDPVAAGRQIKIYRETEIRFPLVDYRDRQSVSESDLDLANRQAVFIAQETRDASQLNMVLDKNDNYDARGRRIINVAKGVDDTDAVNMLQLKHTIRVPSNEAVLAALPAAALRANKVLTFDEYGTPMASVPFPQSALALELGLASAAGARKVRYLLPGNFTYSRTIEARLGERPSILDLIPPGTDLYNTDLTPYVQNAVNVYGTVWFPKGNYRINGPVYVRSDRQIEGVGNSHGGSVIRSSTAGPVFIGGNVLNDQHTRIKISGFKFVADFISDRTKFTLSFLNGFMNEFSNLSFGDIKGQGNQQNGMDLGGTAHWIREIRGIDMAVETGLDDSTGILIRSTRGTNKYSNIQAETNGQIVLIGERNSTFTGIHCERSRLRLIGSTWNLFSGGYVIDGTVTLDDRSAGNKFMNIGGANGRWADIGMFNDFENCAGSIVSHGALRAGLGESYVKQTVIADLWDSPVHKAYVLPTTGWYIAICMCKNTTANGTLGGVQSGTASVFNLTTSATLDSRDYTITNNSGIVGAQAQGGNATQTVMMSFFGTAGDRILVRDRTGVVKAFISPAENVNPRMVDGSAWAVAGAPALVGESFFTTPVNFTPTMLAGELQIALTGATNYGITQFYRPRTAAELYCVIVRGKWIPGSMRVNPYSGNSGERVASVSQNLDIVGADGYNYLVQYIDGRAISSSEGNTRVAVGLTTPPAAQTISVAMIMVFPVR